MIQIKQLIILVLSIPLFFGCKKEHSSKYSKKDAPTKTIHWQNVHEYYLKSLNEAIVLFDSIKNPHLKNQKLIHTFLSCREAFKKAEPFAAHLKPEAGHRVNGPALPTYKEDSGRFAMPVGLQTIEEFIYEGDNTSSEFLSTHNITKGLLTALQKTVKKRNVNEKRFFIATHQQLLRIVSLAMAGFDTPVSLNSIKESAVSLKSLLHVYDLTIKNLIIEKNTNLNKQFNSQINSAVSVIEKNSDFESFDRFSFIKNHLNPITRTWVQIRKTTELWDGSEYYAINFDAPTFFEKNSFNTNYFTNSYNKKPNPDQITLGKKLFFDPKLSKAGTMACATCHKPDMAYTDNLKLNKDNQGNFLTRNTPTLLNAIFQKGFFWDGRSSTIQGQIGDVFKNEKEFNTEIHQFSNSILKDTTYVDLFKKAYGKIPKGNKETIKAIAAYIATLNSLDSKFDKNIRGEIDTFTSSEKRGFNLYMGKALCATCHFMPLTNGSVPPFYNETEKEVIGVPETANNKILDDDLGFYTVYGEEPHRGMFKTPTVRNASLTAPFMHNGVYNSLEEVIDFYNKGGGGGLGFKLPYQTLPFDNLDLNEQEQKDIIAFIKTLEDANI